MARAKRAVLEILTGEEPPMDFALVAPGPAQPVLLKPERRFIPKTIGMIHVDLLEAVTEEITNPGFSESIDDLGVLQAISIVKADVDGAPHRIISGRRRVKAARICGIEEVPYTQYENMDDAIADVAILAMNDHRAQNILAEIRALKALKNRGLTVAEIADACRVPKGTIDRKLFLLLLHPLLMSGLESGVVSAKVAETVCRYSDFEQQQLADILTQNGRLTMADVKGIRKAGAGGSADGLDFGDDDTGETLTAKQSAAVALFDALEAARGVDADLSERIGRFYQQLYSFAQLLLDDTAVPIHVASDIDTASSDFGRLFEVPGVD